MILDKLYPIGSIYLETTNTNPSSKLGGTWVAYGTSDNYLRLGGNGSGGSNSLKLAANQIPSFTTGNQSTNHTHSIPILSGTAAITMSTWEQVIPWEGNQALSGTNTSAASVSLTQGITTASGDNYSWDIKMTNKHTHSVSTVANTTGNNSVNHTHTYTNNNQQNVAITPSYVQVYAWKRTA